MGRARARQTDDDHRLLDPELEDLRVALQQVPDQESARGVARAVAEPEHASEAGALRVGVHLGELHREPLAKVVGPEVVEPGAIHGPPRRRRPRSARCAATRRTRGRMRCKSLSTGAARSSMRISFVIGSSLAAHFVAKAPPCQRGLPLVDLSPVTDLHDEHDIGGFDLVYDAPIADSEASCAF